MVCTAPYDQTADTESVAVVVVALILLIRETELQKEREICQSPVHSPDACKGQKSLL